MVQQMKGDDKTFAQLAESALAKVLHEGAKSQQIDVVFDVYKEKRKEPTEVQTEAFQFKNKNPVTSSNNGGNCSAVHPTKHF